MIGNYLSRSGLTYGIFQKIIGFSKKTAVFEKEDFSRKRSEKLPYHENVTRTKITIEEFDLKTENDHTLVTCK